MAVAVLSLDILHEFSFALVAEAGLVCNTVGWWCLAGAAAAYGSVSWRTKAGRVLAAGLCLGW